MYRRRALQLVGILFQTGPSRQPDGGDEIMATGIANPGIADITASGQFGAGGSHQRIATTRTSRPHKIAAKLVQSGTNDLGSHGILLDQA